MGVLGQGWVSWFQQSYKRPLACNHDNWTSCPFYDISWDILLPNNDFVLPWICSYSISLKSVLKPGKKLTTQATQICRIVGSNSTAWSCNPKAATWQWICSGVSYTLPITLWEPTCVVDFLQSLCTKNVHTKSSTGLSSFFFPLFPPNPTLQISFILTNLCPSSKPK